MRSSHSLTQSVPHPKYSKDIDANAYPTSLHFPNKNCRYLNRKILCYTNGVLIIINLKIE